VREELNERQALVREELNQEITIMAKEKESQIVEEKSPSMIVLMATHPPMLKKYGLEEATERLRHNSVDKN